MHAGSHRRGHDVWHPPRAARRSPELSLVSVGNAMRGRIGESRLHCFIDRHRGGFETTRRRAIPRRARPTTWDIGSQEMQAGWRWEGTSRLEVGKHSHRALRPFLGPSDLDSVPPSPVLRTVNLWPQDHMPRTRLDSRCIAIHYFLPVAVWTAICSEVQPLIGALSASRSRHLPKVAIQEMQAIHQVRHSESVIVRSLNGS